MRKKGAMPDQEIAEIARRQQGVVADWQLAAVGLSASGISRRADTGRLHRIHRGVYAVGHVAPSQHREWMAAVIACARRASGHRQGMLGSPETVAVLDYWGAALSHRSAAELWKLLPARQDAIDVSVRGHGGKKRRPLIRVHRSLTLVPAQVTLCGGIPVTKLMRTIADLRRVSFGDSWLISPRELRRAIRQANVLGLPIDAADRLDRTRSDLERDFLLLCSRHRIPPPEVNVRIGPHLVDFFWRDQMVVVETDGYLYHRGREIFHDDRARDLDLRARGLQVIRLSESQVDGEAARVVEVLCRALRVGADVA
jgi:very-short-patch-repair endonuclease